MNRLEREPIAEENRTTRQRVEIAFSRFLDAIEDDDSDAFATYGTRLSHFGVSIGISLEMSKTLRGERASSTHR